MSRRAVTIVGANLAGARTAEALRARGFDGRLTLIGAEELAPYERPPLSKQALSSASPTEPVWLRSLDEWAAIDVDLRLGDPVVSVDRGRCSVRTRDGAEIPADTLVVATGARARALNVPGSDLPGVLNLRTYADAIRLSPTLAPGQRVVVIGAGVIGTEVASMATDRGCKVTLVAASSAPPLRRFGTRWGAWLVEQHRARGVQIRTGVQVEEIWRDMIGSLMIELSDRTTIAADVVVVGIGVEPQTTVAEQAGALVDNGVVVDGSASTTVPGVWAVGDVTLQPAHRLTAPAGKLVRYESVQNAADQADVAAASILGQELPERDVPWFWSDQLERNVQVAGRLHFAPGERGDVVVRSSAAGGFTAFHLVDQRLVGVFGVDTGRDVRAASHIMRRGIRIDREALADPTTDLRKVPEMTRESA